MCNCTSGMRLRSAIADLRRRARNPYSRSWLWIPGSLVSLAPRNDRVIFAESAAPSSRPGRTAAWAWRRPSAPAYPGGPARVPAWWGVRRRALTRPVDLPAASALGTTATAASPVPIADRRLQAGPTKHRIWQAPPQSRRMRAAYPSCRRVCSRPETSRSPLVLSRYQRKPKCIVLQGTGGRNQVEPLKLQHAGVAILGGKHQQRAFGVPGQCRDRRGAVAAYQDFGAVRQPHHQDGAVAVAGGEDVLLRMTGHRGGARLQPRQHRWLLAHRTATAAERPHDHGLRA